MGPKYLQIFVFLKVLKTGFQKLHNAVKRKKVTITNWMTICIENWKINSVNRIKLKLLIILSSLYTFLGFVSSSEFFFSFSDLFSVSSFFFGLFSGLEADWWNSWKWNKNKNETTWVYNPKWCQKYFWRSPYWSLFYLLFTFYEGCFLHKFTKCVQTALWNILASKNCKLNKPM